MPIRIILPGIIWFAMMMLIICAPLPEKQLLYFDCIPSRSFVHLFLYLGFVHTWLGACKKQLKYDKIRIHAFRIVFGSAIGMALLSEAILLLVQNSIIVSLWNLLFDVIGAGLGIVSFRILYRACY